MLGFVVVNIVRVSEPTAFKSDFAGYGWPVTVPDTDEGGVNAIAVFILFPTDVLIAFGLSMGYAKFSEWLFRRAQVSLASLLVATVMCGIALYMNIMPRQIYDPATQYQKDDQPVVSIGDSLNAPDSRLSKGFIKEESFGWPLEVWTRRLLVVFDNSDWRTSSVIVSEMSSRLSLIVDGVVAFTYIVAISRAVQWYCGRIKIGNGNGLHSPKN